MIEDIFYILEHGRKRLLAWICNNTEKLDEESRFAIAALLALAED